VIGMADERLGAPRRDELDALTQGYIAIFPTFPTADSRHRGRLAIKFNAAGVADEVKVCRKKADGTYGWVDLPEHIDNTTNPHATTAAQVGALTQTTADDRYVGKIGAQSITGALTCQGVMLAAGTQETGKCGLQGYQTANSTLGVAVNFKTTMSNVPSSITLTAQASANFNSLAVSLISFEGFLMTFKSASGGTTQWVGIYTTVGN
jgi:hypothetical protein